MALDTVTLARAGIHVTVDELEALVNGASEQTTPSYGQIDACDALTAPELDLLSDAGVGHGELAPIETGFESPRLRGAAKYAALLASALSVQEAARDLRLLDLTRLWPTRAGASMALSTGPRPRARRWAQAIYEAFPDVDGLLYGSSMAGNAPCIALFERAAGAQPRNPDFHRPLSDPTLEHFLVRAATALGYQL